MHISYQFLVTSFSFPKTKWLAALEASVWNVVQFSGDKRFAEDAYQQKAWPRGRWGVRAQLLH